ncbi:DUF3613 domain-containing protein [Cupriavidus pauculus]|uniref:DUF3613 domain-containing protein n=1 Tax=Cupriavidus pauculus TaxID=82633 RepID=UPI001EE15DDD|nr:DUF3613 domain-containing protein [Cupriavidus pauculus]GJG94483.1 DUF3613 domain-containing protein [Cupriavidus pauculus]
MRQLKLGLIAAVLATGVCIIAPVMAQPAVAPLPVRPNDVPVGDTTRSLLDIQRNGSQAGPMLPLTGEQATLGYARYMQSFTHPLPQFFTTMATGSPLRGGAGSQSMNGQ